MQDLKLALDAFHPSAFYAALTATVGLTIYMWRKIAPASFEILPRTLQEFPSVAIGAGLAALASGGDPLAALAGAFSGLAATGGHWALKRSPLPYGDKPAGANDRVTPVLLVMLAAILMGGCSGTFEEARDPRVALGAPPQSDRCAELDDRAAFYGGAAKGSALLAGGAGLATIPASDDRVRLGLAIGSAAMGAIAAGSGFVSSSAATSWARECGH
jgi:hypothetical protein